MASSNNNSTVKFVFLKKQPYENPIHSNFSFFLSSCETNVESKTSNPPNVVIVFTDDQGYQDLGSFGSPNIITPHLDQMAKEGLKLTNFYAAQAVCSASRAGLLSGCFLIELAFPVRYFHKIK